ncbi:aminotransferase [Calycina marina]|uniref:Aminotransferase n=1 Tax=Calycina marina TaxID=1763456 RepID=A0A9P8CEH4_9HELO|nr:aminotransferase [Calycina marina]
MEQELHFQLFSSLRYDVLLETVSTNTENWGNDDKAEWSPFYMLPLHRDRILKAAQHFGWDEAVSTISGKEGFTHLLQKLNEAIPADSPSPLRVRTLLSKSGEITVETNPTPPVSSNNLYPARIPPPRGLGDNDTVHGDPERTTPWTVLPDTKFTTPSPYTSYKTTHRDVYNTARSRVGIESMTSPQEVLIVSTVDGEIMEGSFTSVFFWRHGKWITPSERCGGQIGTTRRWALERGFCEEGRVEVGMLVDGEECWVSNGVRGFIWGKVKLM